MLFGLCLIVIGCTGCMGFMSLWTVGNVAIGAVGVALAALGSVLSPAQVAAIMGAVAKVQALWKDLKTVVTDYTSTAAEGTLAAVEAVIAALQAALPDVEAAANIGNPIVKAVVAAVLAAVSDVLVYLAANVLPKSSAAMAEYKTGDSKSASDLDNGMKLHAAKVKADLEAAIAASGASPEVVKAINEHIDHGMAHHIGPIRI